jgi:hypothetical protein
MSDNEQHSGTHEQHTVQIRVLLGDLGSLLLETNNRLGIPVITHYVAETRRRTLAEKSIGQCSTVLWWLNM